MDQALYNDLFHAASSLALAIPRVHLALLFVPAMALKELKGLLKTAVVIAVALPVAVQNFYTIDFSELTVYSIAFTVLKEAGIGMVLGFLLSLPFNIFLSAGAIIDNQRGATSGQLFDPTLGSTTFLGTFMQRTFAIVLIEAGMFALIFSVVIDSFVVWAVFEPFPELLFSGEQYVINQFNDMTIKIVLYVMPILVVMLLIDLGFSILGLFSPQLQVYSMAMPAKTLVALLVLVMYASTMWYYSLLEAEKFNDLKDSLPIIMKSR